MLCERAIEILDALRNKQDIPVSNEEMEELKALNCITILDPSRTSDEINQELADLKMKWEISTDQVRKLNKDLLGVEHDLSVAPESEKIKGFFGRDPLKKQATALMHEMSLQEKPMNELKQRLLELGLEKETAERAVLIDGHRAFLTPIGEQYAIEINARPKYKDRMLGELKHVLEQLDMIFSTVMANIEAMHKIYSVSNIWAPYLNNIGFNDPMYASNWKHSKDVDAVILDATTDWLLRYAPEPRQQGDSFDQRMQTIQFRIHNSLQNKTSISLEPVELSIYIITKMLAAWSLIAFPTDRQLTSSLPSTSSGVADEDHVVADAEGYLRNLDIMLDSGWSQLSQEPIQEIDDVLAVLLLAFTTVPGKYEYFIDRFKDLPQEKKLFAALATLFPWYSEETWTLLLRAESNILRDQRAKFVPELNEYAILLSMNPEIIAIENNVTPMELATWKYVIVPAVQAIVSTALEERIYSSIQSRPMSYITSPYYYRQPRGYMYFTTLHYHTIG